MSEQDGIEAVLEDVDLSDCSVYGGDCVSIAVAIQRVFGGEFVASYANEVDFRERKPAHVAVRIDGEMYDGGGQTNEEALRERAFYGRPEQFDDIVVAEVDTPSPQLHTPDDVDKIVERICDNIPEDPGTLIVSDAQGLCMSEQQSFADRMSSIMEDAADQMSEAATAPGDLSSEMAQAVGGDRSADAAMAARQDSMRDVFSMVQDEPFKAAEVQAPTGTGTVTVLYPAPMPRPPNTVSTRFVSPAEAMRIAATTPLEPINYASESFPDLAFAPSGAAGQMGNGN